MSACFITGTSRSFRDKRRGIPLSYSLSLSNAGGLEESRSMSECPICERGRTRTWLETIWREVERELLSPCGLVQGRRPSSSSVVVSAANGSPADTWGFVSIGGITARSDCSSAEMSGVSVYTHDSVFRPLCWCNLRMSVLEDIVR